MKKIKSTPQNVFFYKSRIFGKLYHALKNAETVLRFIYIQTISPNKNVNQTPHLGIESKNKKECFPQIAKTMSYD